MSENTLGAFMEEELVSQPDVWQRAIDQASAENLLPADGQRIAVIGCGTSWFMAQSYAAARESAGKGVTDAPQTSRSSHSTAKRLGGAATAARVADTLERSGAVPARSP